MKNTTVCGGARNWQKTHLGWKLPDNTGTKSFSNLLGKYGLPTTNTNDVPAKANQLANFPLNFLRTGYYNYTDGKATGRMTSNYLWSSTRYSVTDANRMIITTNVVSPQNNYARGVGFALRCVAGMC